MWMYFLIAAVSFVSGAITMIIVMPDPTLEAYEANQMLRSSRYGKKAK